KVRKIDTTEAEVRSSSAAPLRSSPCVALWTRLSVSDEEDQGDCRPEYEKRPVQPASDVVFKVRQVSTVFHEPVRFRVCCTKLRRKNIRFDLRLLQGDAGPQPRNDCNCVAPGSDFVHHSRGKELNR